MKSFRLTLRNNFPALIPALLFFLFLTSCGAVKTTQEPQAAPKQTSETPTPKKFIVRTIAFYNQENLFDTIDDPEIRDDDFTPRGSYGWTSERYRHKIHNMAKVISGIGRDKTGAPPVVLGVAEVENRNVMEDLVNDPQLKPYHYGIIHFDSPDHRGIDVGLLYMKGVFQPIRMRVFPLKIYDDQGRRIYTRDVLLVSGNMDGEELHIIVNHWPSRRGGEARSRPLRMAAARLDMQIIDSLQRENKFAKIIIMGDLNDDPDSPSVKEVLRAKGKKADVQPGGLYAAMEHFYRAGIGTLAYRDSWNLFDQIFVSYPLIEGTTGRQKDYSTFKLWKSGIYNKTFLTNRKGAFKGYPFRTYAGGQYLGGYSDHFPTYIILIKQIN